jgi:hypothetical protein
MSGFSLSPLIETAIGLVFFWFLAATLCSGIVEAVASVFAFRAATLWRALEHQLTPGATDRSVALKSAAKMGTAVDAPAAATPLGQFVDFIPGVTPNALKRVSQVDGAVAADALFATRASSPAAFDATQLGKLVQHLPTEITTDALQLRDWFGRWFDGEMKALGDVYRRNIRWWAFLVSVLIVLPFGLDSVSFGQRLYQEPAQRALIEAQATKLANAGAQVPDLCEKKSSDTKVGGASSNQSTQQTDTAADLKDKVACAQKLAQQLSGLKVALWWQVPELQRNDNWLVALGLVLTIAAIALGAPFWFGVLRRLTGLGKDSSQSTTG